MVSEEIALQFAVTHWLTDGRTWAWKYRNWFAGERMGDNDKWTSKLLFSVNLGQFYEVFDELWPHFDDIYVKIFNSPTLFLLRLTLYASLVPNFWLFCHFFWKWFFANISRTVRARAKILVEINPLGHKHTPPDLFPAKNVIIIKVWHGSKIWSFFNEKKIKKCWILPKKIDQISCFGPDITLSNNTPLYSQQILKFWGKI